MVVTIWKCFKSGLRQGFAQVKIAVIVYMAYLLLAATIGIQVYHVLEASIGDSLELESLVYSYDHTVISDLLNIHGGSISPLLGQVRWLVLIFLVIGVFINSGVLSAVVHQRKGWAAFWNGGANYFFPFLKIAIFFGVTVIIWSLLLLLPMFTSFPSALENLSSEKPYFLILIMGLFIYLIVTVFLICWSVASRIIYIKQGMSVYKSIILGFLWVISNRVSILGVLICYMLPWLFVWYLYLVVENSTGMVSGLLIFIFIVIQQLMLLLRIFWKISFYGTLSQLYQE